MAELLRQDLVALGFRAAELVPTSGHPGVRAYFDAGAPRTLAVCMMYDVQPVEKADWRSPPFAAELVETSFGRALMARGTTNQKGPRLIQAIASLTTPDGITIAVPGYYDAIRAPTQEEQLPVNAMVDVLAGYEAISTDQRNARAAMRTTGVPSDCSW